ncbi:oligosaccharide flippase family protein [Aquimarina sp. AU58]|uniref:oligosaccharide flippase family protein n=1 Tax=Aquimarina sp. AU58 TaxID=1874112 RepID=UPI000D64501E|nr:oligosaccharide flippase family protein [Aquimarina sp. AU58]
MKKSIESIASRLISIASKFLTLTFLAKVLSLSDYGSYQLITYFVMISVYIYGVEYYMFGNREVAKRIDNSNKINDHLSFFITTFPVTFMIQLATLFYLIPHDILSVFIVIFIIFINFCEYFNQEIYRYLIMMQQIRKANVLLISKAVVFLILIFGYHFLFEELELNSVVLLMFISYLILLIITSYFFFKYVISKKEIKIRLLSIVEFKKTFRFLLPFIGLMIFTKGLEFFDKFAIEYFYGTKEVGIYSFLFSIASLIYIFVTSGFYLVYLPELIEMNEKKISGFKEKIYRYSILVIISSIILIVGIVFTIEILLNLIGKSELIDNINLLYILLGSFFLLNIATIPNIILYVANRDKDLMKISGITFAVNIVLNIILIREFYVYGAALALFISYLINCTITFYKGILVWKKIK